jgi:hypothetical protein
LEKEKTYAYFPGKTENTMKYLCLALLCFQMAYAQMAIPAFPGIELVDYLESSQTRQYHLRKGANAQVGKTKNVSRWMVNLEQVNARQIDFVVRDQRRRIVYQGAVMLGEKGGLKSEISYALPGQSVMLLFVADRIRLESGHLEILPMRNAGKALVRQEEARDLVTQLRKAEFELDFERWRLRQLRKFGDNNTNLPQLREEANRQLQKYLKVK